MTVRQAAGLSLPRLLPGPTARSQGPTAQSQSPTAQSQSPTAPGHIQ